ncbi:MAG TPA: hypothetical protein VFN37_02910 [Candidatus Baltobacteraceae bacterium]|nr:hypothetical protein [Candidatus Baltobacteraceae bacterium]
MNPSRLSAALLAGAVFISLAGCGGAGAGGATPPSSPGGPPSASNTPSPSPAPSSSPPPVGTSSLVVKAEENFTNPDMASWYTSGTASWTNHAGDAATGNNGNGDSCDSSMTSEPTQGFHSHAFVGIFYNGTELGLPQAIGMENPVEPTKGTPSHQYDYNEVENASCMFHVHTHDYSGLVHVEVPEQPFDSTYQSLPAYANLQTLVDIWGGTLSARGLTAGANSLSGPVSIYTGMPTAKDGSGDDLVNSYTPAAGSPSTVMLGHHQAIWIVIGAPPANGLPQVAFVIQN